MRSGSKLIIDSLTSIQPLFSAVADLTNICVQTEQAIRTLQQSTSGLVTIIKETTRESTSESVRTITSRQEELNGMLFPMLTAINDGMNSLNVVIERSDELIKQLPMSTAAERILDDLRNISDSAQQNVSRDATTIASTLDKVTVTEQNIQQTLIAIRATLEQLERSSAKNTYDFARLSSDVNALTAEIAKPFWKKLGDRRN
jgi:mevalonate kinase